MDVQEILAHVDHTLLTQTATWEEIRKTCEDAEKFLEVGADRLGTSRIVKLVKAQEDI